MKVQSNGKKWRILAMRTENEILQEQIELHNILLKAHAKGIEQAIDLSIRTGVPLVEYRNGKVIKVYPKYKYVKVPIKSRQKKVRLKKAV